MWIPERDASGTVVRQETSPRSYIVQEKDGGTLQRNRRDLVLMTRSTGSQLRDEPENTDETNEKVTNDGNGQRTNENEIEHEIRTRSGRVLKLPQKYM